MYSHKKERDTNSDREELLISKQMHFTFPSTKPSLLRRLKAKRRPRTTPQKDYMTELLQSKLQKYSFGRGDKATLTYSSYDDCCAMAIDGLVFVVHYANDDKSQIHIQTFFPQTRPLSELCIQQLLEEDQVKVESNDFHMASLKTSMESSVLHESIDFKYQIDRFVVASSRAEHTGSI